MQLRYPVIRALPPAKFGESEPRATHERAAGHVVERKAHPDAARGQLVAGLRSSLDWLRRRPEWSGVNALACESVRRRRLLPRRRAAPTAVMFEEIARSPRTRRSAGRVHAGRRHDVGGDDHRAARPVQRRARRSLRRRRSGSGRRYRRCRRPLARSAGRRLPPSRLPGFEPDACLVNRYAVWHAEMGAHRDYESKARDLRQPIVSADRLPAQFLLARRRVVAQPGASSRWMATCWPGRPGARRLPRGEARRAGPDRERVAADALPTDERPASHRATT